MATFITITARRNGFRRCGVVHSSQPTDWPPSDFTSEQWRDLLKEPQLILAVKETGLERTSEHRHESISGPSAALPEAPYASQTTLPKSLEAGLASVGEAGGLLLTSLVEPVNKSDIDFGALWEEAHLEELARETAKAEVDFDLLWEEARQEDLVREAAKAGAVTASAKPGKARKTKTEGGSK